MPAITCAVWGIKWIGCQRRTIWNITGCYAKQTEGNVSISSDPYLNAFIDYFLQDPKTEVCIEAMNVLRRLQDPSDPNDPVIYSYIMLMSSPNSKVVFYSNIY